MGRQPATASSARWGIEYFKRARENDRTQSTPARTYLNQLPPRVRARLAAVVTAVADGPPPQFSGGGMFEPMKLKMKGIHEIRVRNGDRLYRLFVILDRTGVGLAGPSVVLIAGMDKPVGTAFSPRDYSTVRALADEYLASKPRSIA